MPSQNFSEQINSEEVHEIITAVPSWILRWGITLVFSILLGVVIFSGFLKYPDVVTTNLKINSLNAPKTVIARQNGKLVRLLVTEGQMVKVGQPLAYLESTANPDDIRFISNYLRDLKKKLLANIQITETIPSTLNLGEVQASYQDLFQESMNYFSTLKGGYHQDKMDYLKKDLLNINLQKQPILAQKEIKKLEYINQEQEYQAYKQLYKNKVISRSEFLAQENKFLSSKSPLEDVESSILINNSNYNSKKKELLEIQHVILDEKSKFLQSVNRLINETDNWMMQHILSSSISGKLSFAGIIQQNQNVALNQEVFIINPGNSIFFGEVEIPQYNMGKIRKGERALIKLKSFPYQEYGLIRGHLSYISDVAYRDSVFIGKISFDQIENKHPVQKILLKNGMQAEADIITEESSLLKRLFNKLYKMTGSDLN
ncbi:HlyD family efflux transporter periplasmic adaptor subunit [Pedobacter sp. R20-19]|uniref:HlyD family efflux transporter periplasmic adaptor subunit n=1 Tax=Pedobacter sp. R20-19 TaxID=1270196 RepID=UPI00068C5863|nr:HlyD family efflux transporter periplasmic adaptor subunit [Pedobacter sp. R20-19]